MGSVNLPDLVLCCLLKEDDFDVGQVHFWVSAGEERSWAIPLESVRVGCLDPIALASYCVDCCRLLEGAPMDSDCLEDGAGHLDSLDNGQEWVHYLGLVVGGHSSASSWG
jgi:hypothetical protein